METSGKRNGGRLTKPTNLSQKTKKKVEVKTKANDKDVEVPMECMELSNLLSNTTAKATGAETVYNYNVFINYPVSEKEERFNMRQCFSKLMQKLLKLDQDMIVGSTTNKENNWSTARDLHTGEAFNNTFSVKQETQNDNLCIIMYGKIKSVWKWKDLKGDRSTF
eukprot:15364599-Ditylum_brightwellii.AAC.5